MVEEGVYNILKPVTVSMSFSNLEELAKALLEVINKNNIEMNKVIGSIVESRDFNGAVLIKVISLLCDRLDNVGIRVDFTDLINISTNFCREHWESIKVDMKNKIEFDRLIRKSFQEGNPDKTEG